MPDGPIEVREGYADVGGQSLHYVEAGDRPLLVLLHGFPGVLVRVATTDPAARDGGLSGGRPLHDTRGYNLSSKPEGFEAYGVDLLAADIRGLIGELWCRVRAVGGSRLGRIHRVDYCDESSGGRRPARDPRRGPSAAAPTGSAPPEPAPAVLVLLLLRNTGIARGRGARQKLALLPDTSWATRIRPIRRRSSSATSRRGRSQARPLG